MSSFFFFFHIIDIKYQSYKVKGYLTKTRKWASKAMLHAMSIREVPTTMIFREGWLSYTNINQHIRDGNKLGMMIDLGFTSKKYIIDFL